jgi:hypothetical protein
MQPDTTALQQLPVTTNWRTTDAVNTYREIMIEHEQGYFMNSSTFWEEVQTDERISAVVETRIDGLLGADLEFVPVDERRKSKLLAQLLGGSDRTEDDGLWLRMFDPDHARELMRWKLGLGFCYGPITWKYDDGRWVPRVVPWHPRFVRWDWSRWQYAVTAWNAPVLWLPRTDEEPRSDGKWFVWGGYRSWMEGLVRCLGVPYLDRTWNQRDAARRSEKYGMGIVKGLVPPGPDTEDKRRFGIDLRNLGAEPTIVCPQGSGGTPGFDVKVEEVKGEGWQIFGDREDKINTNVAVRVLGQNLTTEVSKNGSLAAGQVHEVIRGDKKRADARFFAKARDQVLYWWAYFNTGDGELAPYPHAVIEAPANPLDDAKVLLTVCSAIEHAPPELDTVSILEAHGLPVLEGDELAEKLDRVRALMPQAGPQGEGGEPRKGGSPIVNITATAAAAITKVNEARAQAGLPPLTDGDGDLTIAEYQAKHAGTISRAANADAGDHDPTTALPPKDRDEVADLSMVRALSNGVFLTAAPVGKTRKRARYQEAQALRAGRAAAKAMRPFVERVLAAVEKGKTFDDIRAAIVAEAHRRGADMDGLTKLVAQVNLLARLHGRESALHEVLK